MLEHKENAIKEDIC